MKEGSRPHRPIPALPLVGAARASYGERKLLCVRHLGRSDGDGLQGCCLHNRRIGVPDRRIQITTHNARPPACLTAQTHSLGRAGRRASGSESEWRREARCCLRWYPSPHFPTSHSLSPPSFSLFSTKIAGAHAICRRYVIVLYHVFAYGPNWAATRIKHHGY